MKNYPHFSGRISAPINPHGDVFGLIPVGSSWTADLIDWAGRKFGLAGDALRIAACWNACFGIATEDLIRYFGGAALSEGGGGEQATLASPGELPGRLDAAHRLLVDLLEADEAAIADLKECGLVMVESESFKTTERIRALLLAHGVPLAAKPVALQTESVAV